MKLKTIVYPSIFIIFTGMLASFTPKEAPKQDIIVYGQADPRQVQCYKDSVTSTTSCYKVSEKVASQAPTETQPTPTPKPVMGQGVEQWRSLVAKYFPATEVDKALRVMRLESNGNPEAIGDTNTAYPSCGLFQVRILPTRGITCEEMKNPEHNVEYAASLFHKSGWRPWATTLRKMR